MTASRIHFFTTALLLALAHINSSFCAQSPQVAMNVVDTQIDAPQVLEDEEEEQELVQEEDEDDVIKPRRIRAILVEGNRFVSTESILRRIPYQSGQIFDARKTGQLIKNVYDLTGMQGEIGKGGYYFKHVKLEGRYIGDDQIDLFIVVQEKYRLEEFVFHGNKHLSVKDMEKKIALSDIEVIDEDDLAQYANILKGLYREKDYHNVEIATKLDVHDDRVTAIFDIKEHNKSVVKRVFFCGNNNITDKKLRSLIFTREDWLFGFMDRAGSYQPEAIEGDKQLIENYYQSNGYLKARVYDVAVERQPITQNMEVTFYIEEGEQYTISDIHVTGDEAVTEEFLLERLPINKGDLFSREKIKDTLEWLRLFWGEYGYIYADIEPSIQPDDDAKTVSLGFYSELGPKVYLNRVNIVGNEKTRDKVIRRQLVLEEGSLLTTKKMEASKSRVESLGYFDPRAGVNWKVHRIAKNKADLDLVVRETKTGKMFFQVGFGGNAYDITSPANSLSVGGVVSDSNLLGLGINFNLSGELSKQNRILNINIINPWLFDKPIYAALDTTFKRSIYDDIQQTKEPVTEDYAAAALSLGFTSKKLYDATLVGKLGVDTISHNPPPKAVPEIGERSFQEILNQRFANGSFGWTSAHVIQDLRNHPIHPSRGHQVTAYTKFGFPTRTNFNPETIADIRGFGFLKFDADASWYTPIIGERDLVLALHGHIGAVSSVNNKDIPFRELYNIGGPATVRGFLFGEIGPNFRGDSIGASKALWLNAELLFPIASDFSIKGALFYDGGAGWDSPHAGILPRELLSNNGFGYRHAVGFGVRVLNPTPIQVDWGFKLDRKRGEEASQVHLTMSHNF